MRILESLSLASLPRYRQSFTAEFTLYLRFQFHSLGFGLMVSYYVPGSPTEYMQGECLFLKISTGKIFFLDIITMLEHN